MIKRIGKVLLLAATLLSGSCAVAQVLIPAPQEMTVKNDRKMVLKSTQEQIDTRLDLPDEGYLLDIRGQQAVLKARTSQGLVWARQTLAQLKDEQGRVPQVSIRDWPVYPIRGFMHDTGRNFRPVEMLKKDLDLFSFYKLNVFHWHLTDRPAWRIESHAYPQLNDPKNHRQGRDEGLFYTYDDIREVIRYARERGIMIIPEIDMPGHSNYFPATFGFEMASPQGMEVLGTCLKEFFREIPREDCPYIHIGSDEVHVNDPKGFMAFCEGLVLADGRIPVAWDPGLPASPQTVGQIWSGAIGTQIAREGYSRPFIDSYQGYLNIGNPIYNTTRQLLHRYCSGQTGSEALGSILCLWNDIRIDDQSLLMQHNSSPGTLVAFAERIWHGGDGVDVDEEDLLPERGTPIMERIVEFEQRLAFHRDRFLRDWNMRWVANSMLNWRVTLPERRGTNPEQMKWVDVRGGVMDLMALCKKHGIEVQRTMDAWAETRIWAERDTVMTAMVGFEAPARSNRVSNGIGDQGHFEADGRVFVNGTEVFPAEPWKEPGKYQYRFNTWHTIENEIPYTEEQLFWMRSPAVVPLKAGWNTVRLYCPRLFELNHWCVTFMPVTVSEDNHLSEAKGFRYGD